jgi:hypothetical protein
MLTISKRQNQNDTFLKKHPQDDPPPHTKIMLKMTLKPIKALGKTDIFIYLYADKKPRKRETSRELPTTISKMQPSEKSSNKRTLDDRDW